MPFTLVLAFSLMSLPIAQDADDALIAYRAYLKTCAGATTVEQLLPYYARESAEIVRLNYPKMPKEMQANFLAMQPCKSVRDFTVTKRTVDASKAVFEVTTKRPDGTPASGTVTLLREQGVWKVDEEAWALPFVPPPTPPASSAQSAASLQARATEPGKVFVAFLKAARAKDFAAMKPLVTPDVAKQLDRPNAADLIATVEFSPDPERSEMMVTIDGDEATVQLRDDTGAVFGRSLRRLGGVWKISSL